MPVVVALPIRVTLTAAEGVELAVKNAVTEGEEDSVFVWVPIAVLV